MYKFFNILIAIVFKIKPLIHELNIKLIICYKEIIFKILSILGNIFMKGIYKIRNE